MGALLEQMAADIGAMREASTAQPADPAQSPVKLALTKQTTAGTQTNTIAHSDQLNLVVGIVGVDTTGRYVLQIGADVTYAWWQQANTTIVILGPPAALMLPRGVGVKIVTPASAQVDASLFGFPGLAVGRTAA